MGRKNLDCAIRVAAIEHEANAIDGPIIIVAHSGGVVTVAHWARQTRRPVKGALLATPADFEQPMRDGYPAMDTLAASGWLPIPRDRLPFPSIVAASQNDPLGRFDRIAKLAEAWGSRLVDLGFVGHLNPTSGYGDWADADKFIAELNTVGASHQRLEREIA
jgi:hypothetical protein